MALHDLELSVLLLAGMAVQVALFTLPLRLSFPPFPPSDGGILADKVGTAREMYDTAGEVRISC